MTHAKEAGRAVADYLAGRADELHGLDMRAALTRLRAMRAGIAMDDGRIQMTASDAEALAALIAEAEHDPEAWDACAVLMDESKDIAALGSLAAKVMRGQARRPSRPGRDSLANASRDLVIAIAVQRAIECGLPAYANGSVGNNSTACEIVAAELQTHSVHITPEGVRKIWMKYPHNE